MTDYVFTDPYGKEHTVTGPEGSTKEQAFQILQTQLKKQPPSITDANTAEVPKNEQVKPADILDGKMKQSSVPVQEDKGLVGNIQQDVKKRFDTGVKAMTTPGQNPADVGLKMAGQVAMGTAADIGGDLAKSAYQNAPDIANWKEKVEGGIQKAMNSPMGQAGIQAAKTGGLAYMEWAKEHPDAADRIESLVDIASILPIKAGSALATGAAKTAGKVAGEASLVAPIARGFGPSVDKLRETTSKLKNTATNTIEKAKKSGANLSANLPEDAKKEISGIEELSTSGDIANAEKTNSAVKKFIDSISEKEVKNPATGQMETKSGDLSLRNLLGHRQAFDSLVGQGGAEGIAAKKVSKSIENIIDNAIKNNEIVGGNKKDVADVLKFKSQWSKAKQHETLVNALESAQEDSGKAKKAMQKMRDSDYFKTFPPIAQQAINTGAKGRTRAAILDAVGKISRVANFKNLGWAEVAATLLHSPHLAIGAAVVSGAAKLAKEGGKKIHQGDIRRAIKSVEQSK